MDATILEAEWQVYQDRGGGAWLFRSRGVSGLCPRLFLNLEDPASWVSKMAGGDGKDQSSPSVLCEISIQLRIAVNGDVASERLRRRCVR